jgi:hypothetical protein
MREPQNSVSELDGDMTDIADQRSHNTDVDNTWDCRGALTAAGLSCGSCGTELPPNYTLWNECGAPVTKIGHSRASTALFAIRQNGKMTLQMCCCCCCCDCAGSDGRLLRCCTDAHTR